MIRRNSGKLVAGAILLLPFCLSSSPTTSWRCGVLGIMFRFLGTSGVHWEIEEKPQGKK